MTKKDRISELRRLSPWLTWVGDIVCYKDTIFKVEAVGASRLSVAYSSGENGFCSHLELAKGIVAGYYEPVRVDKNGNWGAHALSMLNQQLINE